MPRKKKEVETITQDLTTLRDLPVLPPNPIDDLDRRRRLFDCIVVANTSDPEQWRKNIDCCLWLSRLDKAGFDYKAPPVTKTEIEACLYHYTGCKGWVNDVGTYWKIQCPGYDKNAREIENDCFHEFIDTPLGHAMNLIFGEYKIETSPLSHLTLLAIALDFQKSTLTAEQLQREIKAKLLRTVFEKLPPK